ncbi:MAG: cyclic nucleotide-binding/CBS domain-containing protein [Halobacteriota archaeon]
MKVEDVMNRRIALIDPDATALDAIECMVDNRIRSIVVKPDENGNHGVLCIRDIVFRCLSEGSELRKIKVKEIATVPLVYVKRDMDLEHTLELMRKFNIARVFVKEDKKVVGVVALMDVLVACMAENSPVNSLNSS